MNSNCILIKVGGSIAEKDETLLEIAAALTEIRAAGPDLVLVHGGGGNISRNMELLDEKPVFVDGLRVTSPRILAMVEMTLSGYVNKKLVGFLNLKGESREVKAAGISGVDAATLVCTPVSAKLGQVGKIIKVNTGLIETLLTGGFIPVVSPISVNDSYEHYNVNADEAAAALAPALKAVKFVFLSDVSGVLDAGGKVIPSLTSAEAGSLIDKGIAAGGMIPKLKSCLRVLTEGVGEVHICGWDNPEQFVDQILHNRTSGTVIRSS